MKPDRFRSFDAAAKYDAVVVGAGLGGLSTAAVLSQRGKKVLVIDQHYVPGGNASVFRRKGYVFEVGVHYVGDCDTDGLIPRVLADAGVTLNYLPMDAEGFDTFCFADGTRFAYPRGVENFEARLHAAFPKEGRGIRRWLRFMRETWNFVRAENVLWKQILAGPSSLLALVHLNSTLAQFLDTCTQDARLRTVLVGPHLDHGVAPSRVSAMLHAGLMMHYLYKGAVYPQGGGQFISDALADRVEAGGGKVLLLTSAEQILVEGGRATGVVFHNKHLGRVTVRAPLVVSNADVKNTYARLLPTEAVPSKVKARIDGYEMAPGIAVLYLGVKKDALGPPGLANTNYWIVPNDDVEQDYDAIREGRFAAVPTVGITISSNKDPTQHLAPDGVTNLQVMALAPSNRALWGATGEGASYRKDEAYLAQKQAMRGRLLTAARRVFPNLESGIVFEEMATPITHARYTRSTNGTPYGIAATPKQFDKGRPGAATHIPGLVLAGASCRNTHGVVGALQSGREAAKVALKQLASVGR